MTDLDIEKLKQRIECHQKAFSERDRNFIETVTNPYFGSWCGGNLNSPVWICALEGGGGFDIKENPFMPYDNELEKTPPSAKINQMQDWLRGDFSEEGGKLGRPGGSSFIRTQVALLTAIIDDDAEIILSRTSQNCPRSWIEKHKINCADGFGLSLNVYPISLKAHKAEFWEGKSKEEQYNQPVLLSSGEFISFREWTGISFDEYLTFVSVERQKEFSKIRKIHRPALIYCGGNDDEPAFLRVWSDGTEDESEDEVVVFSTDSRCRLRWLYHNGHKSTLLAVGPFFGCRKLNSYRNCYELAKLLRERCDKEFGKDDWRTLR